jgi:transcriptional regulator with XRE-family HTH domain
MNLRLRELRESQGISVATMIERLGVKDSRYRKWESQSAAMPLEYAMRCCTILHCTLDELSGRVQMTLTDDERELVMILRSLDNDEYRDEYRVLLKVARSLRPIAGM